jgi:hypothetical protein
MTLEIVPKNLNAKSIRFFTFIFAFGFLAGCASGNHDDKVNDTWHSTPEIAISSNDLEVLEDASHFHEVYTTANLPLSIVSLCTDRNGKLAEPSQQWNGTDVIYPNLPFNRFIWAATNGEYYVVHYERGGFLGSAHILIVVLKQNHAGPKIVWRGTGQWLKNYEAFLTALQDNKLYEDTVE